ncbi:MAG: hypothetical protein Sylvanvirus13_16 [Sylvanvirus sp.]|uniref:Uncharacterized protein n=1 Tax=Sylvanvirus sp. TaxID=2487774 RepID=A0A3G5ALP2_9VIRU|nr:MAG: hypothetical protein Sylvanvirus13_16 [Sylvanvirus sp.]
MSHNNKASNIPSTSNKNTPSFSNSTTNTNSLTVPLVPHIRRQRNPTYTVWDLFKVASGIALAYSAYQAFFGEDEGEEDN